MAPGRGGPSEPAGGHEDEHIDLSPPLGRTYAAITLLTVAALLLGVSGLSTRSAGPLATCVAVLGFVAWLVRRIRSVPRPAISVSTRGLWLRGLERTVVVAAPASGRDDGLALLPWSRITGLRLSPDAGVRWLHIACTRGAGSTAPAGTPDEVTLPYVLPGVRPAALRAAVETFSDGRLTVA